MADKLLKSFARRVATDRVVIIFVFLILVGLIVIIIYFSLNPNPQVANIPQAIVPPGVN